MSTPAVARAIVPAVDPLGVGQRLATLLRLPLSWVILAIAVRVILAPLQHTWDSQTWLNVVAQLGQHGNPWQAINAPFETERQMTDLVRGTNQAQWFEYWAYPPGMLLLWWPVAQLWTALAGPIAVHFAAPDVFTAAPIPPLLSILLKLPVMAADLACAALLARLANASIARWYLFNPYVLLVGLWTFDPLMLALLLGGLLAAEGRHWAWSGVLLGLGAAIKFVPGIAVVAVVLWALRVARKPLRSAAAAGLASVAAFAAVCLPWKDGVLYVLTFQGGRVGGGMSWQGIWSALTWIAPLKDTAAIRLYASSQIGLLTLTGALLIACLLAWWRQLDLLETALVLMLAYLVGSKLVNEVYALPALALAAVVAHHHGLRSWPLVTLLWMIPLLFAMVNVPIWGFVLSAGQALGLVTLPQARQFHDGYLLTYGALAPVLTAAGAAFQLICVGGVVAVLRLKPGAGSLSRPGGEESVPQLLETDPALALRMTRASSGAS